MPWKLQEGFLEAVVPERNPGGKTGRDAEEGSADREPCRARVCFLAGQQGAWAAEALVSCLTGAWTLLEGPGGL